MALTEKDVQRIIGAQREVFATREDLVTLEERITTKFDQLLSAVDAYAKKADTYFQEMAALSAKMNRLERNLEKVAKKVGIDLE